MSEKAKLIRGDPPKIAKKKGEPQKIKKELIGKKGIRHVIAYILDIK